MDRALGDDAMCWAKDATAWLPTNQVVALRSDRSGERAFLATFSGAL